MSTNSSTANEARLDDCHSTIFSLADLSGIKWHRFSSVEVGIADDPVLTAFTKCLAWDILAVWRRSPKKNSNNQNITLQDAFEKELWIFWWGEEPCVDKITQLRGLKDEERGCWEEGLSYVCRTLLFKAIHNLVERCLLNENFVRVGRWFLKPWCKEVDEDISDRFSFSFSFFLHGESSVCTTVEVAKHRNLERLNHHHIQQITSTTAQNSVVLAPYGLEARMTGVVYRSPHDPTAKKLLEEWKPFYPLGTMDDNGMDDECSDEDTDDQIPLPVPPVVEIILGGIHMNYPSHFVLVPVTDPSASYDSMAAPTSKPVNNCTSERVGNSINANKVFEPGSEGNLSFSAPDNNFQCHKQDSLRDRSCSASLLVDRIRVKSKQSITRASSPHQNQLQIPIVKSEHETIFPNSNQSEAKPESPHLKPSSALWTFSDSFKDMRCKTSNANSSNEIPCKRSSISAFHRRFADCMSMTPKSKSSEYPVVTSTMARTPIMRNQLGESGEYPFVLPQNTTPTTTIPSPSNQLTFQQQAEEKLFTALHTNSEVSTDKLLTRPFVTLGNGADAWASNSSTKSTVPEVVTSRLQADNETIEIQRKVGEWNRYKLPSNSSCTSACVASSKRPLLHCNAVDPNQAVLNYHPKRPSNADIFYSCHGQKRVKVELEQHTEGVSSNENGVLEQTLSYAEQDSLLALKSTNSQQVTLGTVNGELAGMMVPSDPYAFDDDIEDTMTTNLKHTPATSWPLLPSASPSINARNIIDSVAVKQEPVNGASGSHLEALLTQNTFSPGGHVAGVSSSTSFATGSSSARVSSDASISFKSATDLKFSMDDLLHNVFEDGGAPTPPDDSDDHKPHDVPTMYSGTSSVDMQCMFPTPPSLESCQFSPEGKSAHTSMMNQSNNVNLSEQTFMNGVDHNISPYYNLPGDGEKLDARSNQLHPSVSVHLASPLKQDSHAVSRCRKIKKYPSPALYNPISCPSQLSVSLPSYSYTPSWQVASSIQPVPVMQPSSYPMPTTEILNFQPFTPNTPNTVGGVTPSTPGHVSVRTPASVHPLPSPAPVPTPKTPGRGGICSVDIESPLSAFATPNSAMTTKGVYVDQIGNASIFMNLLLSDSLFNLFWDRSFDQCALCVCNTTIYGSDVEMGYLPTLSSHETPYKCSCGFSAVRNRVASIGTGLFLEDELEIVGAKNENFILQSSSKQNCEPSLLSGPLADGLIHLAMEYSSSPFSLLTIFKEKVSSKADTWDVGNFVTRKDELEVFAQALSGSLSMMEQPLKIDADRLTDPIHAWKKSQRDALTCANTSDIYRLLVSLKPVLQDAIQKKRTSRSFGTTQHVKGPLTWREFCKETGKNAEPQPVPSFLVGYDKDWLSISPNALKYWEKLYLEPYSSPRDVAYVVVCPDSDNVVSSTKFFFRELSSLYESYRLGRLKPYNRAFKEAGILKIGKQTSQLPNVPLDDWFQHYQHSVTSQRNNGSVRQDLENLMMYARACISSLVPALKAELNLDLSSLYVRENRSRLPAQVAPNSTLVSNTPSGRITPSMNPSNVPTGHNPMPRTIPSPHPVKSKDTRTQYPLPYDASSAASIVIYLLDPFQGALSSGLWQCFLSLQKALPKPVRDHVVLQIVPVESILQSVSSQTRESLVHMLKSLSFSTFAQCRKTIPLDVNVRTMTGFGPKVIDKETRHKLLNRDSNNVYTPPYVLSLPFDRSVESSIHHRQDPDYNIFFMTYCLSHNQKWVLAAATDQRGEIMETCCINIDVPPKRLSMARKHRLSVRSEAIRKLWKFCINTTSRLSTKPWRIVVGKLGRLSHGEIRDWAKYLNRVNLLNSGRQASCSQCKLQQNADTTAIISACLTSLEPDGALRIMPDVVQANNFGRSSVAISQTTQLKTPEDISCTHIYVFPTSAVTQLHSSNYQAGNEEDGLLPDADILLDGVKEEDLGDLIDFGGLMDPLSPGTNSHHFSISDDDVVKPPTTERLLSNDPTTSEDASLSQQPLALGYMVSTAPAGPLPSWFWATCPHAQTRCPLFLRFALHVQGTVNDSSNTLGNNSTLHPLDSTKTAVVLRFVLENYNALSWLTRDPVSRDRRSCLPVHCLALMQLYNTIQKLV